MPVSHKRYIFYGILILIIGGLITARLYLNVWVKDYVNQVLDSIPGHKGTVADIDIDLYRGAYRIHQLKLYKKTGNIPTPFINIEVVDLSIEWGALFHGRIVSNADLTRPEINFAVNRAGTEEQTGAGVDWSKPIRDLSPIDINLVKFREGKLAYRDFSTTPQVNIYIHHMSGEVHNLRNVVDKQNRLPSTLAVKGDSIGNGKLTIDGKLNILKPFPDMDLDIKLEQVYLPALSDYSDAYASVDIREGDLDVYSEVTITDGQVSGYVKPIARQIALIDLRKHPNPLKLVWETVVAAAVKIFTNLPRDQFATKIPLEGNLNNIDTDTLAALGGIIRNAFFEAVKRGFDQDASTQK